MLSELIFGPNEASELDFGRFLGSGLKIYQIYAFWTENNWRILLFFVKMGVLLNWKGVFPAAHSRYPFQGIPGVLPTTPTTIVFSRTTQIQSDNVKWSYVTNWS